MSFFRFLSTRRKGAALFLAIAPPASLALFVLWTLHHSNPRVIAPVPIDRNSLLPHRYAGPCMNCHRIKEIGPVAMNAGNMDSFRLAPYERQLLLAGQRVDVPGLSQRVGIPAITRIQNLPHGYVGVCSNCHVILDVVPSPEFMKGAMRAATEPIFGQGLAPAVTARGGAIWDASRSRNRSAWGYAALATLLVTTAALVARRVLRGEEGGGASRGAALMVHEFSAAAFCAAATLHWYYSDRGNNFLHLALVVLSGLSAGGGLLHHRLAAGSPSTGRVLLHTQRFAFFAFLGLLAIGHLFGGFM